MKAKVLSVLAFVLGVMLMVPTIADAGGTKAGSIIRNRAYLSYNAGGAGPSIQLADSVDVTVATVVGVSVAYTVAPTTTIGDSTRNEIAITLTNTGNSTDLYNLVYTLPTGWSTDSIYADLNGNGVLDPAEWVSGNTTTASGNLNGWTFDENGNAASQQTYSFIVVNYSAPYLAANTTHVDSVNVTGTTTPTVGGVATGTQITTWTIQRAAFSVTTKTIDTTAVNGYGNQAGSTVEYTITITAANGTNNIAATNIVVKDAIPANMTYVGSSAAGGDTQGFASDTVTWTIATLAPGASAVLTFEATIDAGTAGGTNLTNEALIAYDDGNITGEWVRDVTPAPFVTIAVVGFSWNIEIADSVETSYGATITNGVVEPNNRILYLLRLTNTGTVNDEAILSFASTVTNNGGSPSTWPWSFYLDDNDQTFEPGAGDGSPLSLNYTTATTGAAGTIYIWAAYTPAYNAPYNAADTTRYFAASNSNPVSVDTATSTTNVNAPFISLTKTVFGDASGTMGSPVTVAAPGDTLWYRVYFKNNGDATATNVVLTDGIPVNTTYITGTVDTSANGTVWDNATDGADADGVTASQGAGVSYSIGSLAPAAEGYIRFRVTVK